MKFVLVFGVVVFGIWLWRHNRQVERTLRKNSPQAARPHSTDGAEGKPAQMVSCAQCGLHLPLSEAVAGPRGNYCTHAHRSAHES